MRPRDAAARKETNIAVSLFRRIVRILFILVGCILLVVVLLIGSLFWYATPPSDASLERRFYQHRADFEQLVRMMEEDAHMQRVAEGFTRNDDWDTELLKQRQISEQRWNQYREIFRRAGVPMGTERDDADDIEIAVWAFGLAIAERSLSYIHCDKRTAHSFANSYQPCFERMESGRFEDNDHLIRYQRIEGDWYIFEFAN